MSWKDIETKWAAMARRVGSEPTRDSTEAVVGRTPEPQPLPDEGTPSRAQPPVDRPTA